MAGRLTRKVLLAYGLPAMAALGFDPQQPDQAGRQLLAVIYA